MNKLYSFKLTEKNERFEPFITDDELLEKSEYGMKKQEKPSKKVVNFLLNYSKSLEGSKGFSFLLN